MELKLGSTIQHLRKLKNLTQEQMANALGVSAAAVSKWETDTTYPDITLLPPLARLLDVSVDVILDFQASLTEEECMKRLERAEHLFGERKAEEARAYCQQLLKAYPGDLFLQFRTAAVYMKYLSACSSEEEAQGQVNRTLELLESSSSSRDKKIREASLFTLASLYAGNGEFEKALKAIGQVPQPDFDARMIKSGILWQKGETEEAEKLEQRCLYDEVKDAGLNLMKQAGHARQKKEYDRSLKMLATALSLYELFEVSSISAMDSNFYLTEAEIYCELGEPQTALDKLERFVEAYERISGEGSPQIPLYFDKLDIKMNYVDRKEFLLENALFLLEQTEEFTDIRNERQYQALVQRLKNT